MNRARLVEPVARGLAEGAGLRICFGTGWSWAPATRDLTVDTVQLATMPLGAALGVVAHEVGHCTFTRYFLTSDDRRPAGMRCNTWRSLLNVLEDPRVEAGMALRFPGAAIWLADLHALDAAESHARPRFQPWSQLFLLEHLLEAVRGWRPALGLPEPVATALDRTRADRMIYTDTLPEIAGLTPAQRELAVLAVAAEALDLAVPIAQELQGLWEMEVCLLARLLAKETSLRKEAQTILHEQDASQAMALLQRALGEPAQVIDVSQQIEGLARRLRLLIDDGARKHIRIGTHLAPFESESMPRAHLVAELRRALLAILTPERAGGWQRGQPSGRRLDLRKAMLAQADPRLLDQVWLRGSALTEPHATVLLLVDLSGSMTGDKSVAAALAASVCKQVLAEGRVPCAVVGFQRDLLPFVHFDEPWSPRVAARLDEMARVSSARPQMNDDGPCLLAAAERLRVRPEMTRILIIISDGEPSASPAAPAALRHAIRRLSLDPRLTLVGIGIGEGTEHVADFYPNALAAVPVDWFPRELARTVAQRLRRRRVDTSQAGHDDVWPSRRG